MTLADFDVTDHLFREAEYLDLDGRFEELLQQKMQHVRTDKIMWIKKDMIDKSLQGTIESQQQLALSYCPKMKVLSDALFAVSFELNKKTSLGLQITDSICLDCFTAGTFHVKHQDGAFGKADTGRKVTCLYFINTGPPQVIKINGQDVEATHDRLILLKARKVHYEIPAVSSKLFIAYSFISGPADSHQ